MVILMSYALNPNQPPLPTPDADVLRQPTMEGGLLETQRRLAEITEMIHTASLFHDDVIAFSTGSKPIVPSNFVACSSVFTGTSYMPTEPNEKYFSIV